MVAPLEAAVVVAAASLEVGAEVSAAAIRWKAPTMAGEMAVGATLIPEPSIVLSIAGRLRSWRK